MAEPVPRLLRISLIAALLGLAAAPVAGAIEVDGAVLYEGEGSLVSNLDRLPGRADLDITLRCYSYTNERGDIGPGPCYSSQKRASKMEHTLLEAILESQMVPPSIENKPSRALVAYSLHLQRVDRQTQVEMWLHHGIAVDDTDRNYSAPQMLGNPKEPIKNPCGDRDGFVVVNVSSGGRVTDVNGWPDEYKPCVSKIRDYYEGYVFYPAVRDGVAVDGVFLFFQPPKAPLTPTKGRSARINGVRVGVPLGGGVPVRPQRLIHVMKSVPQGRLVPAAATAKAPD